MEQHKVKKQHCVEYITGRRKQCTKGLRQTPSTHHHPDQPFMPSSLLPCPAVPHSSLPHTRPTSLAPTGLAPREMQKRLNFEVTVLPARDDLVLFPLPSLNHDVSALPSNFCIPFPASLTSFPPLLTLVSFPFPLHPPARPPFRTPPLYAAPLPFALTLPFSDIIPDPPRLTPPPPDTHVTHTVFLLYPAPYTPSHSLLLHLIWLP